MSRTITIGDDRRVDAATAERVLAAGDAVHTFLGPGGCDMPRSRVVDAIRTQGGGTLTDTFGWADHHLAISIEGRRIHVETDANAVIAVLAESAQTAG